MARSKSTPAAAEAKKAEAQTQQAPVTLIGRLCFDPELRHTGTGKSVTTIRVAVNPPEGEATFHSVVVWERHAENVCRYLRKGRLVTVDGRPRQRSYQAADGTERQVHEIVARRVIFGSAKAPASTPVEKEVA